MAQPKKKAPRAPSRSKSSSRSTASKKGKGSKAKVLRLADYMPEDERLSSIRRAAERLDEVEQTQEALRAAQRLAEAYKHLGERFLGLEETAQVRLDDLRERVNELAAVKAAVDMSERLGGRATEELDELLDRMGLMRRSLHDEEIELLKKRHKSSRKAAETKARKAAEREFKKKAAAAGK